MDGGAYCCMSAIFDTQNHVRVALRRIKLNIASYVCIAVDNLTTQLACSLASIPTLFNIVFKLTIKECIGKQVPEALSVRKGEERERIKCSYLIRKLRYIDHRIWVRTSVKAVAIFVRSPIRYLDVRD